MAIVNVKNYGQRNVPFISYDTIFVNKPIKSSKTVQKLIKQRNKFFLQMTYV